MTDMETPRHVGRRDHDRERWLLARHLRREIALGFPEAIPPLFDLRGAVTLVHLLSHEARIISPERSEGSGEVEWCAPVLARRTPTRIPRFARDCKTTRIRSCFHHM